MQAGRRHLARTHAVQVLAFQWPRLVWLPTIKFLAFTGPATSRHLLVTDAGHNAVHIIDIVDRLHVGYVATPGAIAGPRGVAARGALVAVTAWEHPGSSTNAVHLFEGSGGSWAHLRVVAGGFGAPGSADGQLNEPYSLRFTADGRELAVVDYLVGRVSLFRVEDGAFVRQLATDLARPCDVEEYQGGWAVTCEDTDSVEFLVSDGGAISNQGHRHTLGGYGRRDGQFDSPSALAIVPGLGLFVRDVIAERLQFFSTPDIIAMSAMSPLRVAWLAAVARGVRHRQNSRQHQVQPQRPGQRRRR